MNPGSLVVALALASPPAPAAEAGQTAPGSVSVEVVRIKRDFGKPYVDLAIDAWTDAARLDRTRLWWVITSEQDRRKPLGPLIERMVKLKYQRNSGTSLTVTVTGDNKEFAFTVELEQGGRVSAYVAVDTDDGHTISRCRTESARLIAHRVLGIPVGLAWIAVTCTDGSGAVHQGKVRHRGA